MHWKWCAPVVSLCCREPVCTDHPGQSGNHGDHTEAASSRQHCPARQPRLHFSVLNHWRVQIWLDNITQINKQINKLVKILFSVSYMHAFLCYFCFRKRCKVVKKKITCKYSVYTLTFLLFLCFKETLASCLKGTQNSWEDPGSVFVWVV